MKSPDTSKPDIREAFRPTNVYLPQWMLPTLRNALYHQSEADYRELVATPHDAHHVSPVHRHRHRRSRVVQLGRGDIST